MKKVIGLCCMVTFLLSGCWSLNEIERMLYSHALGFDYKDGEYEVYVQIINISNVAKLEAPKDQMSPSEVGSATGETMQDAVFKLYQSLDERVFWGHLKYIIFSEEALKKERMTPIIDGLNRFVETRYSVWVYSTKENIKDVLMTTPIMNKSVNLSKLGDPLNSYEQQSFVPPVDMRRLIIGLNEPNHEVVLPAITVTENWERADRKPKTTAEFTGIGIVSPKDFKGFILQDEARGVQWMSNQLNRGEITFPLNVDHSESITTIIIRNVDVKVKPIVDEQTVRFSIDLSLDASVNTLSKKATDSKLKQHLKEGIKKEIMTTYKAALEKDADIYRLSEHLYRKNVKKWKEVEKDGKVELTEDSIKSLNINIRKFGTGRKDLDNLIEDS